MPESGEGRKRIRFVAGQFERRNVRRSIFDGGHGAPLQLGGMIVRARVVVTMGGPPIDNGAVAISGNRIIDVDQFHEIKTRNTGETIDLGERALLPGLINTHCHLDYTCLRRKIPPQKCFADWIRTINTEKRKLSPGDYVASMKEGFAEAKGFGTTTIANLTAFPELISKIHSPIRTSWLAELIDVRMSERVNEIVDSAMQSLVRARPPSAPCGLAPHALFTASENLYRCCQEIARRRTILLTTHLAESQEEMQMFRDASGPLYDFLKSIGRPMNDCGRKTPLERFLDLTGSGGSPNRPRPIEVNRPYPFWLVAHLNDLAERDFELLETSTHKLHVVHCPRSHNYFRHSRFPFERLQVLGFNICLGTDSLATNESLSLFAEMRAFQKEFPSVPPKAILQMATINPARALRQENVLGQIRPGFEADLIATPCPDSKDIFEQIIAFDGAVSWSMVNGKM